MFFAVVFEIKRVVFEIKRAHTRCLLKLPGRTSISSLSKIFRLKKMIVFRMEKMKQDVKSPAQNKKTKILSKQT